MWLAVTLALPVALGLSLAACSDTPLVPPTPPDMAPRSMLDEAAAAAARAACTFKAGAPAAQSLASTAPIGTQIPINNIVVVMMENRSFDHLLGDLPSLGVQDVDVAPAGVSNPDATGAPVARFHLAELCFDDTNH